MKFPLITLAYWFFMLTDGALRMLVFVLGYTPLQLAYLFLLYEFLGMITNLCYGLSKKIFNNIVCWDNPSNTFNDFNSTDQTWSITEFFL